MKTSKILTIAILLLGSLFLSCESDDVSTPPPMVCDNPQIYTLSTTDPYSGLTNINTNGSDETLNWVASGVVVPGGLGTAISNSSTSTYNFDNESYHYYNFQSTNFININSNTTFNNIPLSGGSLNYKYNGITYVSALGKYFILGVDVSGTITNGTIGLFEILNINTGTVALTPTVTIASYVVPAGMETLFLEYISIATDNNDMIYAVSRTDIMRFNLTSGASLHAVLPPSLAGVALEYYGLEYNNNWNALVAISHAYSGPEISIVEINPASLTINSTSANLNLDIPNFYTDYYSSTLSCDEDTYFISTRSANIDTDFYTIDISGGVSTIVSPSITNSHETGNYYFGLESNGNN